jgi:peptide/nickel transport system substrate-binding protein
MTGRGLLRPYGVTVFFSLALLLLCRGSYGGEPTQTPKPGGILRFASASDITSLNPFRNSLSVNKNLGSLVFECLLATDRKENIGPALAKEWEASKDGLRYTLRLRDGVKFHNGTGMTAEDVVWSIQYAQDPKNGAYGRDRVRSIESVTALDPVTVRIVLKEPYVPFLASLSTGFDTFPVVPKGSVPPGRERVSIYPPGTGPFMMAEHKPNQLIVLKKFEGYWQKAIPYLDAIHFKPVEDDEVRFTALRAGDFDVAEKLTYEQAVRIRKGEVPGVGSEFGPEASGYRALIFNTESPPFNNLKLRHAVAFAIDKQKIMEGLTWGIGSVHDQKVSRSSRWFVPLQDRKRDLEKARALMSEAGYPNGLTVKAQISRGFPNPESMQLIQSQLRDVGIRLELELIDFAKNQEDKRTGNFVIAPLGGLVYVDPDLAYYQYFHTESAPLKVSNFPRYSNPRVDRLLEQGRRENDFQKRYRIYKEFLETVHEEVPQITLGFTPNVFGYRSHVRGFSLPLVGNDFFYGSGGLGMTWLDR